MRTPLALLLLSSLLLGCAASKPPQNVGFDRVASIRALAGNYVNLGESGKDVRWYLSAVIWPDSAGTNLGARGIDHAGIVTIEVTSVGDTALHVRGLREDGLEKEQTFVEGVDFQLRSGRLVLGHRTESTMKPEVPVLGVMQTTRELGLDGGGQGKYQEVEKAAGLVYLVVPIVASQSWEVRFRRRQEPGK
jgi:hypothetical protein